jgi:hypothetical protein
VNQVLNSGALFIQAFKSPLSQQHVGARDVTGISLRQPCLVHQLIRAMLMCSALYQYLRTECLRFPKQLFSSLCSFLFLSFSSYLSFFLLFILFCISRSRQNCLLFHLSFNLSFRHPTFRLSLSPMLRPTVSRPGCLGIKHPSGAYSQNFNTVSQLRVC